MRRAYISVGPKGVSAMSDSGASMSFDDKRTRGELEALIAKRKDLGVEISKLLISNGFAAMSDDEDTVVT